LGHKVHPTGFRLGIIKDWQSKWYSEAHYSEFIREDHKLREEIKRKYPEAAISLIEIDRQAKELTITLHTARPGIVIGKGGQRVDEMRQYLEALIGKKIRLNIQEIRQPEMDAYLVAKSVAEQIERRVAYRRAMKQAIFRTLQSGAKGIKISAAGRLANAEIARRQTLHEGQVPLHTLRADIDYGFTEAHTTLGRIGVKVWIYKGQILPEPTVEEPAEKPAEAPVETPAATTPVPEEKLAELVAKMAPAAGTEEKPARAAKTTAEGKPARAAKTARVTAATEKPAPEAVTEEKPARTRAKKAAKATEEKQPEAKSAETKKPAAKKTEAKAAEPEAAAKEAPAPKKRKTAAEAAPKAVKKSTRATKGKEEDKDATA
jgi:small subunit ribosomal protein S3